MKKIPQIVKTVLGVSVALSSTCVWAQQFPSPSFQAKDFGAIDASGLSAERFQGVLDTVVSQQPSAKVVASDNLSIINHTLPTTKTKIFVWTDSRGVKHYSDSAATAPKTAKAKVVVTVQPPYTPPESLLYHAEEAPPTTTSSSETDTAAPPMIIPPSQLPPIPPIL